MITTTDDNQSIAHISLAKAIKNSTKITFFGVAQFIVNILPNGVYVSAMQSENLFRRKTAIMANG